MRPTKSKERLFYHKYMLSIDIRNNLHYWDYSEREDFEQVYFRNKIFKKGQLKLLDITEKNIPNKTVEEFFGIVIVK